MLPAAREAAATSPAGVLLPALLLAALALGVLCATPAVAADGGAKRAGYHADESCPDEHRWHAALAARVPEGDARLLARQLRVEIQRNGAQALPYTGKVVAPDSAAVEREVRGQNCVEVIEALALIGVLVRPTPEAEPASTGAPIQDGWALTPARELALSEVAPPARSSSASSSQLRWGIAAFSWLGSATQPRPSLDYGLGLRAEHLGQAWQPSLRIAAYVAAPQRVRSGAAEARFRHVALSATGCPWRFPRTAALGLRPCLALDLGRLRGEGVGVAAARQRSWPWLSTGAELQLEWEPLSGVQLGALLAAVVPLTRPRFYFLPELTSFQVPLLGFRAGLVVSVLF